MTGSSIAGLNYCRAHGDDADGAITYPEICEIIVSGDIAVVRVRWILTVRKGAEQDTTPEGGIDVLRRQPDGRWSIARMATFTMRPNKIFD